MSCGADVNITEDQCDCWLRPIGTVLKKDCVS